MKSSAVERAQSIYIRRKGINLMEKDPVCGMDVDPKTAEYKSVYQGTTYYFCSPGCKRDFDRDPQKYVKSGAASPAGHTEHMH